MLTRIELSPGAELLIIVVLMTICGTILLSVGMCTGQFDKPDCDDVEEVSESQVTP